MTTTTATFNNSDGTMTTYLAPTPDTLLCLIGGLGHNQWTSEADGLRARCPSAHITLVSDSLFGYSCGNMPDIVGIIKDAKAGYASIQRVVVAVHSMGWITGAKACLEGLVDYFVAVDAAGLVGTKNDEWPHIPKPVIDGCDIWKYQPGELWRGTDWTPGINYLDVANGPPINDRFVSHDVIPHISDVQDAICAACGGGK